MTPRPAADRTRSSARPKTEDETASQRATRRAARGDPQEVEGTEDGKPVTVEFAKDDAHSPRAARGEPQHIEGTEGGEAVTVKFDEKEKPTPIRTKSGEMSLPPTTTAQEDEVVRRQSEISRLWEGSQSVISLLITGAVIYCQINGIQSETLNNAFFFVIATYLQRTNHTRIGGVGRKANEETYRGR